MIEKLWYLLTSFSKIGLFGMAGGNSMIQLIQDECVANRGWISAEEFATIIGVNYLFPGLTAVKLSGFIGFKVAGLPGVIASAVALNLPGLMLSMIFYDFITNRQHLPLVSKLLIGMPYAGIALLAGVIVTLGKPLIENNFSWTALILAIGLFVAIGIFRYSTFVSLGVFILACLMLL
ncbi:MAG: chromate transporter [Prochloraceae cyanobacterium]|nr:chromate transporter [Prochloraceae cyanobacterium]